MVVDPIPNPSTMKLHVLSDLHTEFAAFDLPETGADVVILAGDVGVGSGGLEWLQKQRLTSPSSMCRVIMSSMATTSP